MCFDSLIKQLSLYEFKIRKMLLCVGPEGSGKTVLLKRIISGDKNFDKKTVPTVGVNISTLVQSQGKPSIHIRELGKYHYPSICSYLT